MENYDARERRFKFNKQFMVRWQGDDAATRM
jgi:hypothetical protein